MNRSRQWIVISIVGGLALMGVVAVISVWARRPRTPGREARLTEFSSEVWARIDASREWAAGAIGLDILVGGGARTGDASRARLDISDGTIVRLGAATEFELTDFSPQAQDPITRLALASGTVWVEVTNELGQGKFEVVTPVGTSSVRGSLMSADYKPTSGVLVTTCLEGQCRLTGMTGAFTDLTTGEQAEINGQGQDPTSAHPIDSCRVADWSTEFPEARQYAVGGGPCPQLLFVSVRDGNTEIYVVNASGGGLTNLTNNPASDIAPAWSPDGTKIAFRSDRDNPTGTVLYVMNADGSGVTKLADTDDVGANPIAPTWSPDGRRLAFESRNSDTLNPDIYVVNADGSGLTNLTNSPYSSESEPAWSPNGEQIAFYGYEISLMNPDGSGLVRLASGNSGLTSCPAWSPAGSKIVFLSGDNGPNVSVINADGSGLLNLSNDQILVDQSGVSHTANDSCPAWSPDGDRIAFLSTRENPLDFANFALYVVSADGSGLTKLTGDAADNLTGGGPAWSPDGKQIAFDGLGYGIDLINVDGSGRVRLVEDGSCRVYGKCSWRPVAPK